MIHACTHASIGQFTCRSRSSADGRHDLRSSSGTRTLQRSSSLSVGRPSSSRCCTTRTATAAGQGLNRTHWQAGAAGRSRANVGARPRSAIRRGCGTGSACETQTPAGRWGACVSSTPASPGDCHSVSEPIRRPWRVRGRARGPFILLLRLRVHRVNDWVRGCGLPVRGTSATTHGGAGGLVPWPPRSRFRRALLPACRIMRRALRMRNGWHRDTHSARLLLCPPRDETPYPCRSPALLRSGRYRPPRDPKAREQRRVVCLCARMSVDEVEVSVPGHLV